MHHPFNQIFEDSIRPVLGDLIKKNKNYYKWLKRGWVILFLILLMIFKSQRVPFQEKDWPNLVFAVYQFVDYYFVPIFIIVFISSIYIGLQIYSSWNLFRSHFKSSVVGSVVRHAFEGMSYRQDSALPSSIFNGSGLFSRNYTHYHGEDYFSGSIHGVDIQAGELNVKKVKRGKKRNNTTIIFKGLFLVADFHKHLSGRTVLKPDFAERIFGSFGRGIQGGLDAFSDLKLVELDNPKFEKQYKVMSTDQVEARYIFTPDFMDRILKIERAFKGGIHMAFFGDHVYLAIEINNNLFEPPSRRLFNSKDVYVIFREIQMVLGLVKGLDLDTRIWTKK